MIFQPLPGGGSGGLEVLGIKTANGSNTTLSFSKPVKVVMFWVFSDGDGTTAGGCASPSENYYETIGDKNVFIEVSGNTVNVIRNEFNEGTYLALG